MPNRAIEIHDAFLASVSVNNGHAVLSFSSIYIHQSEGQPGIDRGSGWCQAANLHFEGVVWDGSLPEFPCEMSDGELRLGEQRMSNVIPIPLDYSGSVELVLEPVEGGPLKITGSRVWLQLLGDPYYVEEFPESSSWEDRDLHDARDATWPGPVIRHYRPKS